LQPQSRPRSRCEESSSCIDPALGLKDGGRQDQDIAKHAHLRDSFCSTYGGQATALSHCSLTRVRGNNIGRMYFEGRLEHLKLLHQRQHVVFGSDLHHKTMLKIQPDFVGLEKQREPLSKCCRSRFD
jgi:hypothetical protein